MAPKIIRHATLQSKLVASEATDKIEVKNLQVTAKAGKDAWGRQKPQPTLISVALSLATPFNSAAAADSLDNSTVHYGQLSKDVRASVDSSKDHLSTESLALRVVKQIESTAGQTVLAAKEVDIFYPKATLFGDGAGLVYSKFGEEWVSKVLYLKNISIPCLIGVNSNERTRKQPVVVNIWIDAGPPGDISDESRVLEDILVETISDSSFDTLESLSSEIISRLCETPVLAHVDSETWIRLRIEKPLAVPFADAPAVEILRHVPTILRNQQSSKGAPTTS